MTAVPHIRLIGVVAVGRGVEMVTVGRPRQRAVLAALALRANSFVSRNELSQAVWGEFAPRTSLGNLHTYVSGLRRLLERDPREQEVLRTEKRGYRLCVPPENVDVLEFNRLTEAAKAAWSTGDVARCLATLEQADEKWHGSPLTGVGGPFAEQERERLQRARFAARALRAEALLKSGGFAHATVVGTSLVQEFPLDEQAARLLSTSLYWCGRVDDALAELTALRKRLRDELGAQPTADTAQLYQKMVAGDLDDGDIAAQRPHEPVRNGAPPAADARQPPAVTPAQLPHRPWGLVGRKRELAELTRMAAEARRPVVISGYAGIGKTALALAFAHEVRPEFGDGQLYVDLRGSGPGNPVAAVEALDHQLHAFGVADHDRPSEPAAKAALLRSILAERRVLLLLDDVADVAQLSPLLECREQCAVVVTSRSRLSGLRGVEHLTLTELDSAAAMRLLRGDTTWLLTPATEKALLSLVSACGGVPLALRIAQVLIGRNLGDPPKETVIRQVAEELADEATRLVELSIDDENISLLTGLARSCRGLSPAATDLLAHLSKQLRTEFRPDELGLEYLASASRLRTAMAELVEASLLAPGTDGIYRLSPLIRVFGANHIDQPTRTDGPS